MSEDRLSWIKRIDEEQAEGELKKAYGRYLGPKNPNGKVANILKAHSLSPESFNHHLDYYKWMMFGKGPLKRYQREMIAVRVSHLNHCRY